MRIMIDAEEAIQIIDRSNLSELIDICSEVKAMPSEEEFNSACQPRQSIIRMGTEPRWCS